MTSLPRFSILSLCPKCGAQDAGCKYLSAEPAVRLPRDTIIAARPERIVRLCPRCDFRWNEAPLDASPAASTEHAP